MDSESDDEDFEDGLVLEMPKRAQERLPQEYRDKYEEIKRAIQNKTFLKRRANNSDPLLIAIVTPPGCVQISVEINRPDIYGIVFVKDARGNVDDPVKCATFRDLLRTIDDILTRLVPWHSYASPPGPAGGGEAEGDP